MIQVRKIFLVMCLVDGMDHINKCFFQDSPCMHIVSITEKLLFTFTSFNFSLVAASYFTKNTCLIMKTKCMKHFLLEGKQTFREAMQLLSHLSWAKIASHTKIQASYLQRSTKQGANHRYLLKTEVKDRHNCRKIM